MNIAAALNDEKAWSLFYAWELLGERASMEPDAFEHAWKVMTGQLKERLIRHGLESEKHFKAYVDACRKATRD